ncbi:cytochrome c oxidase assembly protein [Altericroceibacterium xinjiangense]|uniref:cytochrome c oxidase assembly protein n=1 Tax=Altericroceibacterium xinjiangense TaxID=762261 RepID=UPI0019D02883|nr:cytochrome c oxidase assembly protein [Altericroceibacterium xinjiangense]
MPDAIHSAWNLDPILLAVLAAAAWLMRAQPGRVQLGLALAAVAYVSPICALSAGLFSARSVHHLLIVFGATPLLALATWDGSRTWGLDRARVSLSVAFLLNVAVFWAWHVPSLYAWALSSDAAYWVGQAALLGSSVLFWRVLYRSDTTAPAAFFTLIAMVMQMGLLGAILTFAPQAVYGPHFLTTQVYGLAPVADQQLAGLIMWVGSLPLTVIAGWAVLRRLIGPMVREASA